MKMKQYERCERVLHEALDHEPGQRHDQQKKCLLSRAVVGEPLAFLTSFPFFGLFSPVNEMQMLSDDCHYLVLLAKVQHKVDKHEDALLSLQRVSCANDVFCRVEHFIPLL